MHVHVHVRIKPFFYPLLNAHNRTDSFQETPGEATVNASPLSPSTDVPLLPTPLLPSLDQPEENSGDPLEVFRPLSIDDRSTERGGGRGGEAIGEDLINFESLTSATVPVREQVPYDANLINIFIVVISSHWFLSMY